MSTGTEREDMATATTEPVRLPPGPRVPKTVQGVAFLAAGHGMFAALGRRYGSAITVNLPVFGQTVVISDPVLVKDRVQHEQRSDRTPDTGRGICGDVFGPGSMFSLAGDELLARRKLLVPPFHGKRVRSYEHIIEEEVMREIATWPEGREFETLQPMTAHHPQRDPACRVRRRGTRAGRASRPAAAHGHAWLSRIVAGAAENAA